MQSRIYLSRIRAGCERDYLQAHKAIWPGLLDTMKKAGGVRENCFMLDNFVVVHVEAADVDSTLARLAENTLSRLWKKEMLLCWSLRWIRAQNCSHTWPKCPNVRTSEINESPNRDGLQSWLELNTR
jgi:L-rhamnose mutarotase